MLSCEQRLHLNSYLTSKIKLLIVLVLLLLIGVGLYATASARSEDTPSNAASLHRLNIAVVGFRNKADILTNNIWRMALEGEVIATLKEVKAIRILPSVNRVLQQLNVSDGTLANDNQLRQCGELIHAQVVIWGNYDQQGQGIQATAHLINIETGHTSKDIVVLSTNWCELGTELTTKILQALEVRPTQTEYKSMWRRWTTSCRALACYSQAAFLFANGKSPLEQKNLLRQAIEADPRFGDARVTLAGILMGYGDNEEAEKTSREAVTIRPDLAITHKEYGLLLLFVGKYAAAEKELDAAVQLDSDDAETFEALGDIYFSRKEESRATEAYNKSIQIDPNSSFASDVSNKLAYYKLRQVPTYVNNAPPKNYSEQSLADNLKSKLTPEELALVVKPLATNPAMKRWAYQLTAAGTNDLQKAKLLFDATLKNVRYDAPPLAQEATAQEIFAKWNDPTFSVSCLQASEIFISLARAVGLRAYMVSVDETCDGTIGLHICAALYIDDRALLVDPEYSWFGVPHKRFTILDDVQTIAYYLSALQGLKEKQIAQKLAPDLAIVQDNLCHNLMYLDRWSEARTLLPLIVRLDKSGALADSTEAAFALHDGKPEEAIRLLLMAIKINNSDCIEYLELGDSYKALGRLDEAHESFGMALRCWHTKQQSDYIEKAINGLAKAYYANGWRAQLNGDSVSALTALGRAIELNPQYAEAFDLRGFIRYQLHDFPGALTDFHVGCTLESSDIWHVYLWLDRARLGEEVAATEELKVYWANRRVSGLNDWPSKARAFLLAKSLRKNYLQPQMIKIRNQVLNAIAKPIFMQEQSG